mmetsp:Transcript_9946/g.20897  ORF Transcript_9946/g.20897 Transcript_9946/m.20897 type:complete len:201 (+) Transcript_9946:1322-1924(+)
MATVDVQSVRCGRVYVVRRLHGHGSTNANFLPTNANHGAYKRSNYSNSNRRATANYAAERVRNSGTAAAVDCVAASCGASASKHGLFQRADRAAAGFVVGAEPNLLLGRHDQGCGGHARDGRRVEQVLARRRHLSQWIQIRTGRTRRVPRAVDEGDHQIRRVRREQLGPNVRVLCRKRVRAARAIVPRLQVRRRGGAHGV